MEHPGSFHSMYLNAAADEIDAAIFTGEAFIGDSEGADNRRILRAFLERWLREIDREDLTDQTGVRDYTIALHEGGAAYWARTSGAAVDQQVSSDRALIRFEVKLDIEELKRQRDLTNETVAQGQMILNGDAKS